MTETETPLPNAAERAWLNACPVGEARTVTKVVGQVAHAFTVDKRYVPTAALPYLYGPHGTEFKG
jgi:hypothetical protein